MGTKIRCIKCNDIIESKYVHDFVWCKCHTIFVDGGEEYLRCGGRPEDMEIIKENKNNA